MSTPVLATKLYVPQPRPRAVVRPRLIERLDVGLSSGCKLTLVSASAGFGKTTLVSEWIARCGRPAVWLSLDEGDTDPHRFLTCLVAALQTLDLRGGEGIPAKIGTGVAEWLQSPQPPPTETILTTLVNEVAAVHAQFILILDDYHLVDSRAVDKALAFLLEHLPPQMHLVITTREDPQFPLARLRARGQLTELRAADLRFSPTEVAEFLTQAMGLQVSTDDIAALEARTEGWITGLQLAALALQGSPSMQDPANTSRFIQSFTGSHRFVLDYLVEEVLQRQPEHLRDFLLQTAILERLSGPLCDAVTGQAGSSGILETLERGNLFILPLDNERRWYRYHHLLADVLRMRLMAEQPDQVSALHRRASAWHEHNGSAASAIRHALAADDFARAANLIEWVIPAMNRSRQFATLLGWLKALPDALVQVRPVISTAYALTSMSCGENGAVEARLRDAERWLDAEADMRERSEFPVAERVVVNEEEFRRVPGMIALIRAGQALARGDMPETVKNARRVLDLAPENDYLMLGGAASQLGLAAWRSGDLEAARRMTAEGMANLRLAGYISPAVGGAITLADIQIALGHLHEAMLTYERGSQWATEPGAPIRQGAADMHVGMSALHYEHNDLKTAVHHLLTSQALGELAGLPQNPYRWRAAMARIRAAAGDLDGALELLNEAERLYDGNFSPNVRPVATRKTRVWVAQGRLAEAQGWAREHGLSIDNKLSYFHEFDHITLARVLLAGYQSDRANGSLFGVVGLLERLLKAAEEGGRTGSAIEILVLQALGHHAQGDGPAALLPLERALTLAEPEGYVRIFLDEGSSMLQLLREASAREIMPDYIHKLLAAFDAGTRKSTDTPDQPPARSHPKNRGEITIPALRAGIVISPDAFRMTSKLHIESLTQRELEVLKLIAQGHSNREIGERLFLSVSTVKGHNQKLFDKLQVQNRTEAIARARALALL